jgi:hypothetical protein
MRIHIACVPAGSVGVAEPGFGSSSRVPCVCNFSSKRRRVARPPVWLMPADRETVCLRRRSRTPAPVAAQTSPVVAAVAKLPPTPCTGNFWIDARWRLHGWEGACGAAVRCAPAAERRAARPDRRRDGPPAWSWPRGLASGCEPKAPNTPSRSTGLRPDASIMWRSVGVSPRRVSHPRNLASALRSIAQAHVEDVRGERANVSCDRARVRRSRAVLVTLARGASIANTRGVHAVTRTRHYDCT